MTLSIKLGKREARHDRRVPRLSQHAAGLPPPPASSNWWATVGDWQMLANDQIGDCVPAAMMHLIYQQSSYTNPGLAPVPTEAETVAFYSAVTGFMWGNAATDQGSFVLGADGAMSKWFQDGIVCGGVLNKVTSFLQITQPNPQEWQQAVSMFSNLLVGIQLPKGIVDGDSVPECWRDFSGPVAGGHEVLVCGYQTLNSGVYYDVISWGEHFVVTENFLQHTLDEAVTVLNPAFINAQGLNPVGIDHAMLLAQMEAMRDI